MDTNKLNHIAIIIDGNRRWADKQGLMKRYLGHNTGLENVKTIIKKCLEKDITHITFWALSTENWKKRSQEELDNIFRLLKEILDNISDIVENKARFQSVGDITELPQDIQQSIMKAQDATKDFTDKTLNIGLNYGGQDEIIRVIQKMVLDCIDGKVDKNIDKKNIKEYIASHLDTATLPDPQLIIRTGGHTRTSGFMIWQSVYSEWYFTETLWPDFDDQDLDKAIEYFYNCKRNFGA